jgi:hypothetical protein
MIEARKIEKNMGKVWECLKMGYTLELDERTYCAIEDENGAWRLCIKTSIYSSWGDANKDDTPIGSTCLWYDISIDEFDKLVQRIPDDDYFLLTSQMALSKINRDGGVIKISRNLNKD